jgi:hypothetical protein
MAVDGSLRSNGMAVRCALGVKTAIPAATTLIIRNQWRSPLSSMPLSVCSTMRTRSNRCLGVDRKVRRIGIPRRASRCTRKSHKQFVDQSRVSSPDLQTFAGDEVFAGHAFSSRDRFLLPPLRQPFVGGFRFHFQRKLGFQELDGLSRCRSLDKSQLDYLREQLTSPRLRAKAPSEMRQALQWKLNGAD